MNPNMKVKAWTIKVGPDSEGLTISNVYLFIYLFD
jgi:hypothetical protein